MNRAAAIRAWLQANPGAHTSGVIASGVAADPVMSKDPELNVTGEKFVEKLQWTVAVMLREGLLERVNHARPMTYRLGKAPMSKAEVMALCHAGRDKRHANLGPTLKEQRKAAQARLAAERELQRQEAEKAKVADRAKRQRDYDDKRNAQRREERASLRGAGVKRAPIPQMVAPRKEIAPPVIERRESVDEFLVRGGRIQRIAPGAWSTPLRRFPA